MARFYGHFAAAYGTMWFVLFAVALITQSHINLGEFGMFGFPIISLLYAAFRTTSSKTTSPNEVAELRERIAHLEGRLSAHEG